MDAMPTTIANFSEDARKFSQMAPANPHPLVEPTTVLQLQACNYGQLR